ncbi:MAG: VWA domain-containing protein [Planctomycetota bacterium]
MFLELFYSMREGGVPVTLAEYMAFARALREDVAEFDTTKFYFLCRASFCRDERDLDRFDQVFGAWFERMERVADPFAELPPDWLESEGARHFTDEEKRQIEEMGGFRELLEELRKRMAEQKGKHDGGSKWVGTRGTSPFGADGFNPAGVRMGQSGSRHRRAAKVWDQRAFRDFDNDKDLGTRQMKLALRRLRRFTREGAPEELDIDETIRRTARSGGWLDVAERPTRRNRMKILLLLDVGGSMDDHIDLVEQLFTAARAEFQNLEVFYFHNCLYERVWRKNAPFREGELETDELIRTYASDYRLVLVGDASMSPWEISQPGGSVEHWNEIPGAVWMQRVLDHYERAAWLNPVREESWGYTHSIGMIQALMRSRMFPLTLAGLDAATAKLRA